MRRCAAVLTVIALMLNLFILNISPVLSVSRAQALPEIRIFVDGEEVENEKKPVIENSRTLVPIRAVAEKADIVVTWHDRAREVELYYDLVTATLSIGSENMTVYSSIVDEMRTVKLDAVPKIIDGSTYITLRAALEAVGAGVFWDGETRVIYVLSPKKMTELRHSDTDPEAYVNENKIGMGGGEDQSEENETKDDADTIPEDNGEVAPEDGSADDTDTVPEDNGEVTPEEDPTDEPENTGDNREAGEEGEVRDVPEDTTSDTAEPEGTLANITYTGFRKMSGNTIKENELHNIYGKIRSDRPLAYVRCTVADSDVEVIREFAPEDNETDYNLYPDFGRSVKFNGAGVGEKTFEIYAAAVGEREQLIFSYSYTVTEVKKKPVQKPKDDKDSDVSDSQRDEDADTGSKDEDDGRDDTEQDVLGYYGFRTMTDDEIVEGAPHGLYGTVRSNLPITRVRCLIEGTDMDYSVRIEEENEILSYNVFTYFDKLIRFSDAGLGEQTFSVYAAAANGKERLLFSYDYTVIAKDEKDIETPKRESVDYTDPKYPDDVCLPLEGEIRLTSPYGFRAYNKWEFHKGIDIISESLNILSVADGEVVDCATGRNSGAGNYVAIRHEGGWVSLYYHLASYSVEVGDKVKMGQKIAIMGNSGGNYGVHLHFMTCDNWYGGIWATQNNHHTAPHEYVPQILTAVKNYNPNFESASKDKIILCNFHLPHIIKEGTAFSLSGVKGFVASEEELGSIRITVSDTDGEIYIDEAEESPKSTTDGYYIYTNISVALDMKCHFDKLPVGEYVLRISGETANGRERVVYTKAFEVEGE